MAVFPNFGLCLLLTIVSVGVAIVNCEADLADDDAVAEIQMRTKVETKRRPLGFVTSGGGFTSMSGGMGVVRAIGRTKWKAFTHVGGNSGGNWLGTQLVFSSTIFSELVSEEDIVAVLSRWGTKYGQAMQEAIDSGAIWAVNFDAGDDCQIVAEVFEKFILGLQTNADWPATNWLGYITTMLSPHMPAIMGGRYSTASRDGGPDVTYVQALSLGPDAYVNKSMSNQDLTTTSLDVSFSDAATQTKWNLTKQQGGALLPVAFHSSKDNQGWMYHRDVDALTLANDKVTEDLVLPSDPLIAETTSGSSSAAALFGSPSMTETLLELVGLDNVKRKAAMRCFPLGLQTLSSPMTRSLGPGQTPVSQWMPKYRFCDGAFTDNTAVTWTIAKMQADCKASKLDCSEPIKIILVNGYLDLNATLLNDPLKMLFKAANSSEERYTTPGNFCPPSEMFPAWKPALNIFSETFPADDQWIQYANFTWSPPSKGTSQNKSSETQTATSVFWTGEVNTVDNPYFGVEGNWKVEILIFEMQVPVVTMITTGQRAADAFERVYGPIAAAQADGAGPIIDQFLRGCI